MGLSLKMGILIFGRDGPTPLEGYPLIHLKWAIPENRYVDFCKRWAHPFERVLINPLDMGPSLKMGILIFGNDWPTPLEGYPLIHLTWAHP